MLTLEELFHSTLPEGSTVLAGAESLGVEVSWAVALRSRAPGFDGLKGGELAIVSIAAMRQLDDRLTLTRLFDQISGLGVAAVAVVGPVDTNSVAVAERLGLPLLLLPEHTSARDLETRITRAIVERRSELQRLGQDFYHQLLELVVSGHGADSVVGRLAEITGRPAFFQDPALHLLAMRFPATSPLGKKELLAMIAARSADDASRLTALTANAADPPTIRLALPGSGLARIVAPVGGAAGREGYLSVVGPSPELTAVDRLAVSRAAAACAIDLARERASRSDSDLRLAEVLDDLLAGSYPSEAALLGRAQRLGFDLTKPHLALALRAQGVDGLPATRTLERILRREFSRRSLPPANRVNTIT